MDGDEVSDKVVREGVVSSGLTFHIRHVKLGVGGLRLLLSLVMIMEDL